MCDDASGRKSYQVWINNKDEGFSLAQSGRLPDGTQFVSFADMGMDRPCSCIPISCSPLHISWHILDRDGTMDLLITTCSSVSPSTGLGTGCSLNIAYNKQLPLCASPSSSFWSSLGQNDTATDGKKVCRKPEELCTADPHFEFAFEGPVRDCFP